jgi:hypothetical protein
MNMIDPTYLRYIYDGLNSGKINKENVSALPSSLVGIYEEALPPERNLNERSKFLDFFGIWALLKKEVSTSFIAEILNGWTEIDVIEYINLYSKWFNSPVSGKYNLYHERFRMYLLQKCGINLITEINQRIIIILENKTNSFSITYINETTEYLVNHYISHSILHYDLVSAKENENLMTIGLDRIEKFIFSDDVNSVKIKYFSENLFKDHELTLSHLSYKKPGKLFLKILIDYQTKLSTHYKILLEIKDVNSLIIELKRSGNDEIIWLLLTYVDLYKNNENCKKQIAQALIEINPRLNLIKHLDILNKLSEHLPFKTELNKLIDEIPENETYYLKILDDYGWKVKIKEFKLIIPTKYNEWNDLYGEIFHGNIFLHKKMQNHINEIEDHFKFERKGMGLSFEGKVGFVCGAISDQHDWAKIKNIIIRDGGYIDHFIQFFKVGACIGKIGSDEATKFIELSNQIEAGRSVNLNTITKLFSEYFEEDITLNDYIAAAALKRIFRGFINQKQISKVYELINQLLPLIEAKSIAYFQDLSCLISCLSELNEVKIPARLCIKMIQATYNSRFEDEYLIQESLMTIWMNFDKYQKKIYDDYKLSNEDFNIIIKTLNFFQNSEYRNKIETSIYPIYIHYKIRLNLKTNQKLSISFNERFNMIVNNIDINVVEHLSELTDLIEQDEFKIKIDEYDNQLLAILFELLKNELDNRVISDLRNKYFVFNSDWALNEYYIIKALFCKAQEDNDYWIEAEWFKDLMNNPDTSRLSEMDEIINMNREQAITAFEEKAIKYVFKSQSPHTIIGTLNNNWNKNLTIFRKEKLVNNFAAKYLDSLIHDLKIQDKEIPDEIINFKSKYILPTNAFDELN